MSPILVTLPPDASALESLDVTVLIERFKALSTPTPSENRLSVEKQKILIIEAIVNRLKHEMGLQSSLQAPQVLSTTSAPNIVKHSLYYFFVLFSLFEDASGSFLYSKSLFSLIPGFSDFALFIMSLLYTVLNCILFYTFEVTLLKDALDIPYSNTDLGQLIQAYATKLKLTITINQLLSNIHILVLDEMTRNNHFQMAMLLNNDMQTTCQLIGSYHESVYKHIFKIAVILFGVLSSTAGSYFMATSTIELFAPAILGTPMGAAVILLTVFGNLGLYYATGGVGVARLVNPDYEAFQELKANITSFQQEIQPQLKSAHNIQQGIVIKPTQEAITQTRIPRKLNFFDTANPDHVDHFPHSLLSL